MESVRMAIAMVLTLIASYLIGCANFAIIISKLVYHKDIRDYGSGNAGMTNIARTFGKWPAVGCTIGDFLKGTIAALLGHLFVIILGAGAGFDAFPFYGNYLVALGVMLGHCFPVFYGFRGGEGDPRFGGGYPGAQLPGAAHPAGGLPGGLSGEPDGVAGVDHRRGALSHFDAGGWAHPPDRDGYPGYGRRDSLGRDGDFPPPGEYQAAAERDGE